MSDGFSGRPEDLGGTVSPCPLGGTDKKGVGGVGKAWCRGSLRKQVCPHWQNLPSCYEKLGLTKQINKGGVAICFTAGTNKG